VTTSFKTGTEGCNHARTQTLTKATLSSNFAAQKVCRPIYFPTKQANNSSTCRL